MEVYEITGQVTGISRAGVNYLQPADSYQNMLNGYIYRQVVQSRKGLGYFAPRLDPIGIVNPNRRVYGIFEHFLPDGTKQLLVTDANFLYRYNDITGIFDKIPFGGSMALYTGFNSLSSMQKDSYVSGTSYPSATNTGRFVFTCPSFAPSGGSTIFFYDGTNVLDYTDVADNINYVQPPEGPLTAATYVLYFNERINFVNPKINAVTYNQGVLYSGDRTASGNGDKFNVPGSGLFIVDTAQNITGATIRGQVLVLNLDRMAYTLEKTTDAFNPYFGRGVPGPLGTNAKFSAVIWDDDVESWGKTGILSCDGRRNLRTDDKIPYFTQDDVDQEEFNMTYGGFDRINNQFLWSYKESGSQLSTQNKVLAKNYEEKSWSIYDQRLSVFGQTDLGLNLAWNQIDETAGDPSWARWDTTEDIWNKIGLGKSVQKTLAGDDLGFIYDINKDYDDYFSSISAITRGSTTTVTIASTGFLAGDLVAIAGVDGLENADGESGINNFDPETGQYTGPLYVVKTATTTATTTDLELILDTSLFNPYVSGGTASKPINFSAETIPFNPYRSQGRRCYVGYIELLINTNVGQVFVDVYADQQETPFKQNVLMQPTVNNQEYEWISMSVDQEANFLTFVFKQNSPALQFQMSNMRIHCEPGGMTSG